MRILIVDDSKAMRMIVTRELRKAGYDMENALAAENGVAALELLKTETVDLILSDWNMPDMSGIELLTRLRSDGKSMPFGFVTSEAAEDIRRRAFETGANFVVTKPFTGDDLSREVATALGEGSEMSEGESALATSERSVAEILTELLGREVVTFDSPPPDKTSARAIAKYVTEPGKQTLYCVADIAAAASMGAALSRIPSREAKEWSHSFALPEAIQQNFHEVANVLAKVVIPPATGERCVLVSVDLIPDLEELPEIGKVNESDWRMACKVDIDGYLPGRVGFVGV